jgi:hypothetical protein
MKLGAKTCNSYWMKEIKPSTSCPLLRNQESCFSVFTYCLTLVDADFILNFCVIFSSY